MILTQLLNHAISALVEKVYPSQPNIEDEDVEAIDVDILIIGSGPAGLYLLLKLWMMGLRNIVICDPRVGEYTRVGHLVSDVFANAAIQFKDTKIKQTILNDLFKKTLHIKDFERRLYQVANDLGINIAKGRFVRLEQDSPNLCAIVTFGSNAQEKRISARLIFDATGERAVVINAYNKLHPEPLFQFQSFARHPLPTNLIAYVRLAQGSEKVKQLKGGMDNFLLPNEPSQFIAAIKSLSEYGWTLPVAPFCYYEVFGKNSDKLCFYVECPETLKEDSCLSWLSSVLKIYMGEDVSFELLPASKKYPHKKRVQLFNVQTNEVTPNALSNIVPVGDAQISALFRAAHGILNGMERIDLLCRHIEVQKGKFVDFNASAYSKAVASLLEKHKEEVLEKIADIETRTANAYAAAVSKLQAMISIEQNDDLEYGRRKHPSLQSLLKDRVRLRRCLTRIGYPDSHDVIKNLDQNGEVKLNQVDTEGFTPFRIAIQKQDIAALILFRLIEPNSQVLTRYDQAILDDMEGDSCSLHNLSMPNVHILLCCIEIFYPDNVGLKGTCLGLKEMRNLAFARDEVDVFCKRLKNIKYTIWPILSALMREIEQEWLVLATSGEDGSSLIDFFQQLATEKITDLTTKKTFFAEVREKVKNSFPNAIWHDLFTFFEGINSYPVREQLRMSDEGALKSLQLEKPEKSPGLLETKPVFLGIYTHEKIKAYFRIIAELFQGFRMSLNFDNGTHPFTIEHQHHDWWFTDALHLDYCDRPYNLESIIAILLRHYPEPLILSMQLSLVSSSNNPQEIDQFNQKVEMLRAHPEWLALNQIQQADCTQKNLEGCGLLYLATKYGDTEKVSQILAMMREQPELLYQGFPLDWTPLYTAVEYKHAEIVRILVKHVNASSLNHGAILLYTAVKKRAVEIVETLVLTFKNEASSIIFSDTRNTLLHIGVETENLTIVRSLVNTDTNCAHTIVQANNKGHTPFYLAASHCRFDMIQFFLDTLPPKKAQEVIKDAVNIALIEENTSALETLLFYVDVEEPILIPKTFLYKNASTNEQHAFLLAFSLISYTNKLFYPLELAIFLGRDNITKSLMARGAILKPRALGITRLDFVSKMKKSDLFLVTDLKHIQLSKQIQEYLDTYKQKIDALDDYNEISPRKLYIYFALNLHRNLQEQKDEAFFLRINDAQLTQLIKIMQDSITAAIPQLQEDLRWDDAVSNLTRELGNTIVKTATFGAHSSFFKLKPSPEVKAGQDLSEELASVL